MIILPENLQKKREDEIFNKEKEKLGENEFPCTKEELEELVLS